jgi:hypothetical protein
MDRKEVLNMMLLTLTFDCAKVDVDEIGEIEERIWQGLKLSGEYNRSCRDNRWTVQYVIEKKVREETLQKIPGVEKALAIHLRDYAEDNGRGKRKTALVTGDVDDGDQDSVDDEDTED